MADVTNPLDNSLVNTNVAASTQPQSTQGSTFAKDMFGVDDPSQILQALPQDQQNLPDKVRYRFSGDGKTYAARKDQDLNDVLQRIWEHKAPGIWGAAKGEAYYGLPADFSSALSYSLSGMGFDESSKAWRDYSDKTKQEYQQKYGSYMVPSAQAAWNQGKLVDYALQSLGSAIPYLGMVAAGGLAGGAAAGATAGEGGMANLVGTMLGSTAITAPVTIAQFADQQVAQMKAQGVPDPEKNIDWTKVLGYGAIASGLQSLPLEAVLFGGPILGSLKALGVETGSTASRRILSNMADVAGTNAMVNMGTSVLSRAQADMPLLDDNAQADYFNAAIQGGLVGIPFGIGKGLVHPHTEGLPERKGPPGDINQILNSNATGTEVKLPEGATQNKTDYVFFNPKESYGINDPAQAQEFLQSIKMPEGTRDKRGVKITDAFEALRSPERYGPNFTDQQIMDDARRLAFIHGRMDLVRGNSQGILFNSAEEIPQKHSDDPKVLTRAAWLSDKAGYPDTQVRAMPDDIINKLYESKVQQIAESAKATPEQKKDMAKHALDQVDPKVQEDYKNYGSLTARPEAVDRINAQTEANRKILSQDARQNLARELMDKTQEVSQRPQGALPRPTGEGTVINPRNDPEAIRQAQEMTSEGGPVVKEGPFGTAPTKDVLTEMYKPQSPIDKGKFAEFLAGTPLFKKLAPENASAKDIIRRAEQLKKNRENPQPLGRDDNPEYTINPKTGAGASKVVNSIKNRQFNRGPANADSGEPVANARDILADQARLLDQVARREGAEHLSKNPEDSKIIDDLFKGIAENVPHSDILKNGTPEQKPGYTPTKAVKTVGVMEKLDKSVKILASMDSAFRRISDKAATLLTGHLDKLMSSGELPVKDLVHLTTAFRAAFNPKEVEPSLIENFYRTLRDSLPLKQQKALNDSQDVMNRWYQSQTGMNVKDLKAWRPVDTEAVAFGFYARDDHSPTAYPSFRNSKHEQLFKGIVQSLKQFKKELGDQGVKSINDVFGSNTTANVDVPPAARPRVVQDISNEHVQGDLKKELDESTKEFVNAKQDQVINAKPPNDDDLPPTGLFGSNRNSVVNTITKSFSWSGLARHDKMAADLMNVAGLRAQNAGRYQMRMANLLNSTFKKYGKDAYYNAADVLAHMRKTDQSLKEDDQGRFTIINKDGNKVTLTREFSNSLKDVNSVYKEAPKIGVEVYSKMLDQFDAEGLNRNSSVEGISRALDKLDAAIKDNPIDERRAALSNRRDALTSIKDRIQEFQRVMDPTKPYVPFVRFGDHVVQVTDKTQRGSDGKHLTVHLEPVNDYNLFGYTGKVPSDRDVKQFMDKNGLSEKYADRSRYDVKHFSLTYNNATKFINQNLITHELVQGLIASGLDKNLKIADVIAANGVDTQGEIEQIQRDLALGIKSDSMKLTKLLAARGMGKFAVESQNIDGHSTDWGRATENYISTFANGMSRVEQAKPWSDLVRDVELKQGISPSARQTYRDYINYISNPAKDFAGLRAFNYIWAMGFRPSSALIHLPQIIQQVPGLMLQYHPSASNFFTLTRNMTRSLTGGYSNEMKALIHDNAVFLKQNYNRDSMLDAAYGARPVDKYLNQAVNTAGFMLAKVEDFTREAAFASFHEMFNNTNVLENALRTRKDDQNWQSFQQTFGKDMDLKNALALYSVQETHGRYAKDARGPLQRGLTGAAFLPFTTWMQQMMGPMVEQLSMQRGASGFLGGLWVLGSFTAMAGMAGIPGWEIAKTAIESWEKKAGNLNFDTDMWLKENGMPTWARKGLLSTATGLDVSSRVNMGIIGENLIEGFLKGDVKFSDLFGVPGRVASGLWDGAQEAMNPLSTKSPIEAVSPALPVFMQDALKAIDNNPETKAGKVIDQPGSLERLGQAAGFNPLERSLQQEKIYWEGKVNSEFSTFKTRFTEGIAEAVFRQQQGNVEEGKAMMSRMLGELTRYARDNKMLITPEFWAGVNKAVVAKIAQKNNPGGILQGNPSINQLQHRNAFTPG